MILKHLKKFKNPYNVYKNEGTFQKLRIIIVLNFCISHYFQHAIFVNLILLFIVFS